MYEDAFGYILRKIESNIKSLKGKFPHISKNGFWETKKNTSDDFWTLGFWPGMLWLAYKETKNKKYEKLAYEWLRLIECRKNNKDHDLGFAFYPSYVKGYELTGDIHLRNVALTAADSLLSLFNPKSNFIQTRPKERGIAAIDTMMNLFLLWWAYEETKDKKYYDAAFNHSVATMKNLIRDNGSTDHIVKFDPTTGENIKKLTLQGYSNTSCWSRGQAWAIYGFTLAYKRTKDELFLRTAENLAEYFIKNLSLCGAPPHDPASPVRDYKKALPKKNYADDYVPYWDFDDPEKKVKGSSAGQ